MLWKCLEEGCVNDSSNRDMNRLGLCKILCRIWRDSYKRQDKEKEERAEVC